MKFPTEARLRRIIAFVAALGIGVATYITIADSGGGAPTCLAGGGGCETDANSSYSHIAGVNVAVFGIVGYILLLLSAFFANDGLTPQPFDGARQTGAGRRSGRLCAGVEGSCEDVLG